jgi:hypothetical protein
MGWVIDGRAGWARIGNNSLKGFAMMRDQAKGLIAFHANRERREDVNSPRATDHYLISEDDFEPSPPATPPE